MSSIEPTFDVFIIHSVLDISLIKAITKMQKEIEDTPRIRILVAEWQRRPGELLAGKIRELIENCHLVVVVWSHNLEKSIIANQEIGYACALNKVMFPFVFKGMSPKGLLQGTEYIEFDPFEFKSDIQILIKNIRALAIDLEYNM